MKKRTYLLTPWFVIGMLLISSIIWSQQGVKRASSQRIQEILRKIAAGQMKFSPDIPKPTLLEEPQFTAGKINFVDLDSLPESFQINGQTIPITKCDIFVVASPDSGDWQPADVHVIFNADTLSTRFGPADLTFNHSIEDTVFYRACLVYQNSSGEWSNTVWSIQDTSSPQVKEVDPLSLTNGWLNSYTVKLSFTIWDTAGIDSVLLYCRSCSDAQWPSALDTFITYDATEEGEPKRTFVQGTISITRGDGCWEFYLGARDAAYSPQSHGKGPKREASWKRLGNLNEPYTENRPPHASIKIDTRPPWARVRELPKYVNTPSCTLHYEYGDTIPGVVKCVQLWHKKNDGGWKPYNEQCPPQGYFVFNASADTLGDGRYEFQTVAIDSAGNEEALQPSAEASTIIDTDPPIVTKFWLSDTTRLCYDKGVKADSGWTNDTWVLAHVRADDALSGLDSLKIRGVCDPIDTVFVDTLHVHLKGEDGPKTLECVVRDSAGNWSDPLLAVIRLDTFSPVLDSIKLFDASDSSEEITDTAFVKVRIWASDSQNQVAYLALFENKADFPCHLNWAPFRSDTSYNFSTDEPGRKTLWVAVKDSAGNICTSPKSDSIRLVRPPEIVHLALYDYTDPQDSMFTDDRLVRLKIEPKDTEHIIQYAVSETLANLRPPKEWFPFPEKGDTTFILTEGDGRKTVYCKIKNAAGDTSRPDSASITLDTQAPQIVSPLHLYDLTGSEFWPDTAFTGWTNSLWIKANIEVYDTLSGIDSVKFEGDIDSVNTLQMEPKNNHVHITVKLRLSKPDSMNTITCCVFDSAGNLTCDTESIMCDTISPILDGITIPQDTVAVRSIWVKINSLNDTGGKDRIVRVRLSEDSTFAFDSSAGKYEDITTVDTAYVDSLLFTLSEGQGLKRVFAQVRDKAGNWSSTKYDSVWLWQKVELDRISIADTTDISNAFDRADSGWTNDNTVAIMISYKGPLKWIQISEDSTFTDTTGYGKWIPVNGTTVIVYHKFHWFNQGVKRLWCKLFGPTMRDTSNIASDSINIDTIPPPIPKSMEIYHPFETIAGKDTSYSHTNRTEIWVSIWTDLDPLSKMKLWESKQRRILYDTLSFREGKIDTTYVIQDSTQDGSKTIHCAVRDSAGNWCQGDVTASIILDRKPPRIGQFSPSDPSTPGPSDSLFCDDDSVEVTAALSDTPPGRLHLLTLYQLNSGLNPVNIDTIKLTGNDTSMVMFYKYDKSLLQNDRLWVYCRVYDAAGSPSDASDDIIITLPPEVTMTLYDIHDKADTCFSGSDTVGVRIIRQQGLIDSIAISQCSDSLDYKFGPWPAGRDTLDTTYTFFGLSDTTVNETLYCKVKNNIGSWDTTSKSIIIDLQNPTLLKLALHAIQPFCDTSFTSQWNIQVTILAKDPSPGELKSIVLAEDSTFSENRQEFELSDKRLSQADTTISYELTHQEGYHTIWAKVRDKAERESLKKFRSISADISGPEITSHYPLRSAYTYCDSLDSIAIQWNEKILMGDPDSAFVKDSYNNQKIKGDFEVGSDSLTLVFHPDTPFCNLPFYASHFEVHLGEGAVTNLSKLPNKRYSWSFWTFLKSHQGGKVRRYIDDDHSLILSIPPNSLPADGVFILEPKVPPQSPILGIQGFEPVPNTCWGVRAEKDISHALVDSLTKLNKHAEITILYNPSDLKGVNPQSLRIIYKTPGSQYWELLNCDKGFSSCVSYSQLDKISGTYCIVEQTGEPEEILSNYPNPFAAGGEETTIRFVLSEEDLKGGDQREIKIYDVFGNLVRLIRYKAKVGVNEVKWDGRNGRGEIVANGGYLCVIKKGMIRKIAVLK